MKTSELTIPEVALIAGTRGMLGAGIGLLLADKLDPDRRNAVGWTLVLVGALTTIPLVMEVIGKSNRGPGFRAPAEKSDQTGGGALIDSIRPERAAEGGIGSSSISF